jgi:endonuclease-8
MPEGPQVARYARIQRDKLVGKRVHVDSPSGRSDDVADILDGLTLRGIEPVGKHLLYDFGKERYLHIHLGRFGSFHSGDMPLPEVRGTLRLRLYTSTTWFELRGAIAVDIFDDERRAALEARIGPSPLDPVADPSLAYAKITASDAPVGLLLMDQSIVAGIGNIYRSEVLFMHGVHPKNVGSSLEKKTWEAMWLDLVRVMKDGERIGRIVTTDPADRNKPKGAVRREDRFYVYRRTGLPCRHCATAIETGLMATRSVFWCPHCQPQLAHSRSSGTARSRSRSMSTRSK